MLKEIKALFVSRSLPLFQHPTVPESQQESGDLLLDLTGQRFAAFGLSDVSKTVSIQGALVTVDGVERTVSWGAAIHGKSCLHALASMVTAEKNAQETAPARSSASGILVTRLRGKQHSAPIAK